jgi:hypothetical protein
MRRGPALVKSLALLCVLALAGCGGDEPPPSETYAPLHYEYLKQLRLNVGAVDVDDRSTQLGPTDITSQDPVAPGQVLAQMARDRLFAAGTAGRAVFTIDSATITQAENGTLDGVLAAHLEVLTDGGTRAAYAEARVSRQHVPGSAPENLRNNLYDMTRQMMDDMNVELEFQVRRSLRDWLVTNTAVPAPVVAIPLSPATPAAPAPPPATGDSAVPPPPSDDTSTPQQMSPPPSYLQPPPAPNQPPGGAP